MSSPITFSWRLQAKFGAQSYMAIVARQLHYFHIGVERQCIEAKNVELALCVTPPPRSPVAFAKS